MKKKAVLHQAQDIIQHARLRQEMLKDLEDLSDGAAVLNYHLIVELNDGNWVDVHTEGFDFTKLMGMLQTSMMDLYKRRCLDEIYERREE